MYPSRSRRMHVGELPVAGSVQGQHDDHHNGDSGPHRQGDDQHDVALALDLPALLVGLVVMHPGCLTTWPPIMQRGPSGSGTDRPRWVHLHARPLI
jgi:hypothetical protein